MESFSTSDVDHRPTPQKHSSVEHAMSNSWKLNTFSGLAAGLINDIALYSNDSRKVIRQNRMMGIQTCIDHIKTTTQHASIITRFQNKIQSTKPLYRGLVPVIATGTGPALGIFFLVYSSSRKYLTEYLETTNSPLLNKPPIIREMFVASIASTFASIPTSIATIPSDVIKKVAVGSSSKAHFHSMLLQNFKQYGIRSFFVGWKASLAKDIPLAFIKMPLYVAACEVIMYCSRKSWYPSRFIELRPIQTPLGHDQSNIDPEDNTAFSVLEVGIIGALSGAFTALLTMPMDTVNSRMKAPTAPEEIRKSYKLTVASVYKQAGVSGFFAGTVPRMVNFTLGSAIFWLAFDIIQKTALESKTLTAFFE